MTTTTTAGGSLWLRHADAAPRPVLSEDLCAEVVVVGGGIAGVTTALHLQQAGVDTVLLEAGEIPAGVTGANTGKASVLQSTMLSTIAGSRGGDAAADYARCCGEAVEDIATLAAAHEIECELERRPAVTYAPDEDALDSVAGELRAAEQAGVPVRWSDEDAGLPFPVAGAVWLDEQLVFNPVSYTRGLAEAFLAAGGRAFESSRVLSVSDGRPCTVHTATDRVTAEQVVIATHYPILDRGLFFARLEAKRSYCVAHRIAGRSPRPMSVSAGESTRSVNWVGDELIVGGEGHAAGARGVDAGRYEELDEFAAAHWETREPRGRWSAQDPVPYDHLPLIGPLLPRSRRLWVATGWAKWGLTAGTFAARILAASLLGDEHPHASLFSPSRISPGSTPRVAKLGVKFSALLALDRAAPAEAGSAEAVPVGEARVVRDGLGKAGVYRDEDGAMHAVSLRCTHLGCLLRFNAAERSWDCPCHGSRFGVDGEVLEGPAVHPLERREL